MIGLLWERRAQVGWCLLIQAAVLATGVGLEQWLQPPAPYLGGTTTART
ncbi:hypothetical protein [Synechococcus sp. MW101C3]|nr:hypothetical protein [Synechococcus sp. MW101C3]